MRWATVTVDDAALFIGRFGGGALASFEATRFATGRKNALRIEVNGSLGSLAFDFEAMNELWFHDHTIDSAEQGFRRILVTEPDHPYAGGVVAAGSRPRLRAHLRPRDEGLPGGDRRRHRPGAVLRGRAAGAAGAGGRRAERG